jgi:septum formation protein
MGFSFSVMPPKIENEMEFFHGCPFEPAIQALALAKAKSVAATNPQSLVLGGDTIVCLDERVMGKPANREEGRNMLRTLSGAIHKVYSGMALVCGECAFSITGVACTEVTFRKLDNNEIDVYLDTGEYADKAGAYAIQGKALCFIHSISGCFYNVVGLPVSETIRLFQSYMNRKDSDYARRHQ